MSDSEVPRQSAPFNDFDELELPPVPARWDDPPSSLSENDLMRMASAPCEDSLLSAVSDALWEPVDLKESSAAHANRLLSIAKAGAELRERWAETAALEETFHAPALPVQVRMREARVRMAAIQRNRIRRRRYQTAARLLSLLMLVAGAGVAGVIGGMAGNVLLGASYAISAFVMFCDIPSKISQLTCRDRRAVRDELRGLQRGAMKRPE
ncbi:hypothetical protein OG613_44520 (plasmid) [Streptomyces sp. NBC_00015]|uniref:hypothetical protein n=1 Tax=Streptomyces sp. NBC_00015 TaxID=2903611 RepID=UPI002F910BEC